ncbi:MAG: hypothetical protein PHC70_03135 [Patescibacteria group bacterium]|nr:hypothetical protein [Patescibacteria group bacterium]
MKAKLISTREDDESGYLIRHFLFEQKLAAGSMVFEIMAPHLGDRALNEGMIFRSKLDTQIGRVTLKVMLGSTTVITTWNELDETTFRYDLEFSLGLHKRIKDDELTFEVELEIDEP